MQVGRGPAIFALSERRWAQPLKENRTDRLTGGAASRPAVGRRSRIGAVSAELFGGVIRKPRCSPRGSSIRTCEILFSPAAGAAREGYSGEPQCATGYIAHTTVRTGSPCSVDDAAMRPKRFAAWFVHLGASGHQRSARLFFCVAINESNSSRLPQVERTDSAASIHALSGAIASASTNRQGPP